MNFFQIYLPKGVSCEVDKEDRQIKRMSKEKTNNKVGLELRKIKKKCKLFRD
jgi:hypothetical protein